MSEVKCGQVVMLNEECPLEDALGTSVSWKWCVYWYERDDYDGEGHLVACNQDDILHEVCLGHNSQDGPGDCGVTPWGPLSKFLESENVLDSFEYGIGAKIQELFGK